MTAASNGFGTLGVTVWPAYVGVCAGEPTNGVLTVFEPVTDTRYRRGQIQWGHESLEGLEQIVGRAFVKGIPKGAYTHLLYFQHPEEPTIVGSVQLPHPVVFDVDDSTLEVYPITNSDLDLLKPYNAT